MVDFKKMAASHEAPLVIEPKEIFNRLKKPQFINDLHSSQAEVLNMWFNDRDKMETVIKLNTGGGKTLIGLLIALSSARELRRGALYLVDSKQLAHQVCDQAKLLGIPAIEYNGRNSLTADFRNGSTILVAHYRALFNGRSVFGLVGSTNYEEVSTVIIDDAHSSFDTVRSAFTVEVLAEDEPELYRKIADLFQASFASIDKEGVFNDFVAGSGGIGEEVLEIPFWAWEDNRKKVAALISTLSSSDKKTSTSQSIRFSWPLIRDELKYCIAVLSRTGFSITPILPLVDKFPTFNDARRRVYMSATFADESAIIRSFGCRKDDLHIISPPTLAGVGRRMILQIGAEEEYKEALTRKMISLAKEYIGVVVLAPSFLSAEQWADRGAIIAKSGEVDVAVENLKEKSLCSPVVFCNRYNGIDLPGEACRLLVVSGVPRGMSDYQKLFSKVMAHSRIYARAIAQSIEQAIGRGTRGSGDYCVVVLMGLDLCEWVKDDRHAEFLTPSTRAQIECGQSIMKEVHTASGFEEVIDQGVIDDPDFAAYLSSYVADNISRFVRDGDFDLEGFAVSERKALKEWRRGQDGKGIRTLEKLASSQNADDAVKGLAFRIAAQIAYSGGDFENAKHLQFRANGLNRSLAKPAFLVPVGNSSLQAELIVKLVSDQLSTGNELLALYDSETASLSGESDSAKFELGLKALGKYLGAFSERCDKNGEGPDVVWVFEEAKVAIGLEAKNEKLPDNPFTKAEHGQLLVAGKWLERQYPDMDRVVVSVHPNDVAYDNASASSTRVLTLNKVGDLKKEVRQLLDALSSGPLDERGRLSQCDSFLEKSKLDARHIVDAWTKHYEMQE